MSFQNCHIAAIGEKKAIFAGDQIRRDRRIKSPSVSLALGYSSGGHDIAAICRDVNLCRFYFPEFKVLF